MKKIFILFILNSSLLIVNSFSQSGWQIISSGTTNSLHSVHFADYNIGWAVGEAGTICTSTDGGLTWQSSSGGSTLYDVFAFDQANVIIVGSDGLIVRTTNGGITWLVVSSGVTEDLFSVSFNGSNGICGGSNQTILYSTNSGFSWNIGQTGFFGGGFWGASMLTPQFGFVAGENSIFQPLFGKTTDSGVNWDFTAFYLNNNEGTATGVDFTDANNGYVSAAVWDGTGAISKTTNGGTDWITIMNTNPIWDIDFPISGASLIGYAVGENGTILKTFNGGLSWSPQQSGTTVRLNGVHFLDIDVGYAVGANGIILRTIDGGVPVELTSFSARVNEQNVILNWTTATEINNSGFEVEKLFGSEWTAIGFVEGNGTTTEPKSYLFKDENLDAGIYKYRLKQIDFDGTYEYSDIIEAEVTTPIEFELSQNYPNPFNPSTKIKFSLNAETDIQLNVYNTLGQKVAEIFSGSLKEGYHEVVFDAGSLTSGIYFYRLETDQFVDVKKMILLR